MGKVPLTFASRKLLPSLPKPNRLGLVTLFLGVAVTLLVVAPVVAETPESDKPEEVKVPDGAKQKCLSVCSQVRQVANRPRVDVDPAADCQNPPPIGDARAALADKVVSENSFDWTDDPKQCCDEGCFCKGAGDGTRSPDQEFRHRYPAEVTLGDCTITGSVSIAIQRFRRSGECFKE